MESFNSHSWYRYLVTFNDHSSFMSLVFCRKKQVKKNKSKNQGNRGMIYIRPRNQSQHELEPMNAVVSIEEA